MTPFVHIQVINESTVLTDAEVARAIPAFNAQFGRDLAPAWNLRPTLITVVPAGQKPSATTWWMGLFDTSDQPGALGYHLTTSTGLPLGKAFIVSDQQAGLQWTSTVSHEICEMCCDPYIATAIQAGDTFQAQEVCDAVEADADGYVLDGVLVSNFVLPAYFIPGSPGPWDFGGLLMEPLSLRPGGYMSVFNLKSNQGWTQVTAREGHQRHPLLIPGSRRDQRRRQHEGRVATRSTVATA